MTPKEKAKQLYNKFNPHCLVKNFYGDDVEVASTKKCALIAVDEILDLNLGLSNCDENNWKIEKFYEEVKQEIIKL